MKLHVLPPSPRAFEVVAPNRNRKMPRVGGSNRSGTAFRKKMEVSK